MGFCQGCSACQVPEAASITEAPKALTTAIVVETTAAVTTAMPATTSTVTTPLPCYAAQCATISGGWQKSCGQWFCKGCLECDASASITSTPPPFSPTPPETDCYAQVCMHRIVGGWPVACANWFCKSCHECRSLGRNLQSIPVSIELV